MRVVLALLMIPALAHADRTYVVRDGDSCLGIANRELGDPAKLDALHAANPQLGKLPHKLKAGQLINLPGGGPAAADAHLRTMRGRVEVQPAGTEQWDSGTSNQELFRTWRVGTRDRSTAKVEFLDLSTIDMREDTVVMIFGPTSGRASTLRTQLDRGVLRTRLAALDRGVRGPERKVTVDTPAGKAELGQGSAVIDVDTTKETRLANHQGKAAKLSTTRGNVELAPGYGSRAVANKPPSPPIKLLPAPRWESSGALALAWQGNPLTLRGSWIAVPGAVKYRLEIALATSPLDVETQTEVPGTITRLEASGLPAASYLVTVASVDKDGLEGPPSAPLLIQAAELATPRAIAGGVFEPPQGLRCARGDLAPIVEAPVILVPDRKTGTSRITCASLAGHATLELPVAMPVIRWPSRELVRGTLATVDIELRDFDPARLQTIATGVTMIGSTPHGDRLGVQLVGPAAGPARVAFLIDGVTIASEELTVVEPVVSSTTPPTTTGSAHWRWGAAAYGGGTLARRDNAALVGAELWLAPRPWIAPYLGIAKLTDEREGTARFGLRTAFEEGLHPLVRAGLVVFGSERVGGELGAGIEFSRRGFGVRAEATGITEGSDRYVQGVVGLTLSR